MDFWRFLSLVVEKHRKRNQRIIFLILFLSLVFQNWKCQCDWTNGLSGISWVHVSFFWNASAGNLIEDRKFLFFYSYFFPARHEIFPINFNCFIFWSSLHFGLPWKMWRKIFFFFFLPRFLETLITGFCFVFPPNFLAWTWDFPIFIALTFPLFCILDWHGKIWKKVSFVAYWFSWKLRSTGFCCLPPNFLANERCSHKIFNALNFL